MITVLDRVRSAGIQNIAFQIKEGEIAPAQGVVR